MVHMAEFPKIRKCPLGLTVAIIILNCGHHMVERIAECGKEQHAIEPCCVIEFVAFAVLLLWSFSIFEHKLATSITRQPLGIRN